MRTLTLIFVMILIIDDDFHGDFMTILFIWIYEYITDIKEVFFEPQEDMSCMCFMVYAIDSQTAVRGHDKALEGGLKMSARVERSSRTAQRRR